MMKKLGFLMILAGLFLTVVYPWFQVKFTGEEIYSSRVFQRTDNVFHTQSVELGPENNPIRIRLYGHFLPGGIYVDGDIPLTLRVSGPGDFVFSGVVTLSAANASRNGSGDGGNAHSAEEGTVLLANSTPPFEVTSAGTYQLEVGSDEPVDFSLRAVVVSVLSNVTPPDEQFRIPGIALMVFGGILIIRARRKDRRNRKKQRRSKRRGRPTEERSPEIDADEGSLDNPWNGKPEEPVKTPPPEPPKPKKPAIKWGRQGKDPNE